MGFFTRVPSVAAAIGRSWIIRVPPTSPLPARCSMGQTRSLRVMCVSSAAIRNVKMKALMFGITYNGGTSYTIAGGYSDANPNGIDHGYLANWDSATQTASDWTSYDFDNGPHTHVEVSHFDGITTDNQGGFYLTGEWAGDQAGELRLGGFFAHVPPMPHRPFGDARWRDIEYPSSVITTGNTVFENNVFGIYFVSL